MERDACFGDRVEAEARALDMPVIQGDGRQTLAEHIDRVEDLLFRSSHSLISQVFPDLFWQVHFIIH